MQKHPKTLGMGRVGEVGSGRKSWRWVFKTGSAALAEDPWFQGGPDGPKTPGRSRQVPGRSGRTANIPIDLERLQAVRTDQNIQIDLGRFRGDPSEPEIPIDLNWFHGDPHRPENPHRPRQVVADLGDRNPNRPRRVSGRSGRPEINWIDLEKLLWNPDGPNNPDRSRHVLE